MGTGLKTFIWKRTQSFPYLVNTLMGPLPKGTPNPTPCKHLLERAPRINFHKILGAFQHLVQESILPIPGRKHVPMRW